MKNPITPEQLIEQLEKPLNPAQQFVNEVNGFFPGTFPTKAEMDEDAVRGDTDSFTEDEGNIPNN